MDGQFTIELRQQADYRFEVQFDRPAIPQLITDETAPLGGDAGPNPERLLATAVAHCLAASLLFALRKFKNDPRRVDAVASVRTVRNAQGRLRIGSIEVELRLGAAASELAMLDRVLAQFEDFCVVTQSVRPAIAVTVRVLDGTGAVLKSS
ncbi:MAG TPA: OsmC family protein [Burkholderiaceae bacterium]|nr:OsmC family protein [Burkholderiaceae bacterium]